MRGLMIAAPRSGSGKTTLTLGLLRAFAKRGLRVAGFKCGPDYIDPVFHRVATGHVSLNLDSWCMAPALLDAHLAQGTRDGVDLVLVEASMGLFDGVAQPGAAGNGASADIARRFGLPVLLVLDTSGQAQSAGAVALGFSQFDPGIQVAGVVLSNLASERHRDLAQRGLAQAGLPVFGGLLRGGVPALPERHLGLVQADELPEAARIVEKLADAIEQAIDLDAVLAATAKLTLPANDDAIVALPPPGQRIAFANDVAFSFAYPHLLTLWRCLGAEILPFSPLADQAPDAAADCCWLPGGYPELHAGRLSSNAGFLAGLRHFAESRPVHGECGGYMALGQAIIAADGQAWPMASLLPLVTSFAKRKLHLGYRAIRLAADAPIGRAGTLLRGHEFHYATIQQMGDAAPLGQAWDANGTALGPVGQRLGQVSGSFFHAVALDVG
ncbi:cobyrinate a,c-diamide synthase [Ferrovibrio sp.]|uniref:cobyrinate a,c-diamide synthase n=1 Tax=Ferrovibrio sp. TaxID=1917215 RepID=UPI001B3CCA63|nr:cobyrinate a,c-diamide synthase [Ferrovibrio sp.]MBP7063264.1 cobyrinate a,c-diamide synthase [Ferrovibrio sp.]